MSCRAEWFYLCVDEFLSELSVFLRHTYENHFWPRIDWIFLENRKIDKKAENG